MAKNLKLRRDTIVTLLTLVVIALPWVAMKYAQPDPWLVENARKLNLQNRLGCLPPV